MKTYITYLMIAFALIACKSDDDNNTQNPLSQLPPMTTTGENTIGCLVNGEPFTDSGLMNNFYQFVNGESVLAINWEQEKNGIDRNGRIALRNIVVIPNQDYILNKSLLFDGDVVGGFGNYTFSMQGIQDGDEYLTNINYNGKINFTRFDTENQIMSGTFEFEAEEINTGEIISITDGRFDLTFVN